MFIGGREPMVIGDFKNVCNLWGSVSALTKWGDLSIWHKSGDTSPLGDLSKENSGGPPLPTSPQPSPFFPSILGVAYMGWRKAAALRRTSLEELQQ